ncbi:hypothetical protein DFJ58DRAFT_660141 [Suillus subalutaceus]|uniref:uncharacterized protein n=1 Tax=Suillus subalutaceus TaxID=48586 RepID=UPI001B862291|nr:uncharacterized protein DFJ58DRAFT_660141 [Suillus subalutaceus]KAG1854952.1 hypothetical protein DFJ58DRAFT_660141 [Suillus subalutaceus]
MQPRRSGPLQRHDCELGEQPRIHREPFVEHATATAIEAPPGFDEWSISSLTKYACTFVQIKASCVKASAFSMECKLYKSVDITYPVAGKHNGMLIFVRVKYIRCAKACSQAQ